MLPADVHIPLEEPCPVPEHVLGQLYRARLYGLDELILSVPAATRAMLALYCYRRAHLQSIGLAVAASCNECDLQEFGGNAGKVLFDKSRKAPDESTSSFYLDRRKVTLRAGPVNLHRTLSGVSA
jgi:hypothetical protein